MALMDDVAYKDDVAKCDRQVRDNMANESEKEGKTLLYLKESLRRLARGTRVC